MCLKSINEHVWLAVEKGWTPPVTIVGEITSLKPIESWTETEQRLAQYNSKGVHVIASHVTHEEYNRIMTCETSKEAWDIFALTHEGTSTVRASKLQNLTT